MAIGRDGNELGGNFYQLLRMKAEEDPNLAEWLRLKENIYTSPEIQNKIIMVMGLHMLRNVSADLQVSPFLSVMVDETTDSSNQEQHFISP